MRALLRLTTSAPASPARLSQGTYVVAKDLPAAGLQRGDRILVSPRGRVSLLRTITVEQLALAVQETDR
ncbi:hypothetical protein J421_0049 [Gemmatirosa kalamazoonensis]|uniref:Uncharacterized protein n=1 Tax=Gemmatirosa kalamazoonensis TaxID=861299 RepID=W0R9V8_9BACT|nr:hypothetical protein [Gemmatirosa kalamazoonensis]AHG87542.1 hypothetical protein J421_0004 [Gemmatirosa kalamazoonensis]AHG87565.1 hypothetical protein J421_0027 [Gemmatirosa kalamazoonensis]AHG87586.1 hypothetical protein J421_0049 [Gemmatirosa kalamazoonensis]